MKKIDLQEMIWNVKTYFYLLEQKVEFWLSDNFESYHYQGVFSWLYSRLYKIMQYLSPFLKWSRWTFNQCKKNYNKLLADGTNTFLKRTSGNMIYYYYVTLRFGYLKVIERQFVDRDGLSWNLYSYLKDEDFGNEYDNELVPSDKVIFKGFIFTKKQAIKAINHIKNNAKYLTWDSKYSSFNTYWLDVLIKAQTFTVDTLDFAFEQISNDCAEYDDGILCQILSNIDVYKFDTERFKSQIIHQLEDAQQRYKTLGYDILNEKDFKIVD